MKLSEAIRLGSMMKPQAFGHFHVDGGSCAVAAAADAIGLHPTLELPWNELLSELNWDTDCPECFRVPRGSRGSGTLVHLNDDHRWTRERIADWVETIENAQVTPELSALTPAIHGGGE